MLYHEVDVNYTMNNFKIFQCPVIWIIYLNKASSREIEFSLEF